MKNRTGIIYFLMCDGLVKIGFTRSGVRKRIAYLQTGNPHEIELLGYYPGAREDELRLHGECATHRIRGEWFKYEGEVFLHSVDACENQFRRPL